VTLDRQREPTTPLDLLKQRYASGQITHEQLQRAKKDPVWGLLVDQPFQW